MCEITTLPFVKDLAAPGPDGGSRTFWAPDCAGLDPVAAADLGTELALEAVQYMRAAGFSPLLGWAVREMSLDGDDPAASVALGFLTTFARLAMAAATPKRLAAEEARLADWRALWRRLGRQDVPRE